MSEKLRVGVVGLGQRGTGLLNDLLLNMPNIEISAVCDVYSDRVDFASGLVRRSFGKTPFCLTTNWSKTRKCDTLSPGRIPRG